MNFKIRPATEDDVIKIQELRKIGWRDNYVNEESGVTKEVLESELAKLPVVQSDVDYFLNTISKPENKDKNLVAENQGKIIGVVFYEANKDGVGDIGVFVDRTYRGQGIGSALLEELISKIDNDIEVTIFSKNKSRGLYKKYGFVEEGDEGKHYFRDNVFLPIQKLVLSRKK